MCVSVCVCVCVCVFVCMCEYKQLSPHILVNGSGEMDMKVDLALDKT